MAERQPGQCPKVLILATDACGYPGADNVGQIHADYPANYHILRVRSPALFPVDFYLRCFERGIAAVIVMSCGHECPYEGAYERLAARIGEVHQRMKQRGWDTRRLRLCAICTVCTKAFLQEVGQMNQVLREAFSEASGVRQGSGS